jgi:phage terminase large subunit
VDAWRHRDTMHSVGKFLTLFRKLGLRSYQVGGDEGYGHQLMDRMAEQGFYCKRINNGAAAAKPNLYANLAVEWWSRVGELIEHRKIVLPDDEKLVAQLTSRQKLYDSKGRERLESKADMRARGLESPDRADALIGAVMLGAPLASGAIGARELSGICFGRPGGSRALFSAQQVSFEELDPD